MTKVSPGLWDQLVAAYEEAERQTDAAEVAWDLLPNAANQSGVKSREELAFDEAFLAESAAEDRLLRIDPPHADAVALQLRIFARRFHSADLRHPPEAPEEPETAILRRIYASLQRLGQAGMTTEASAP
jgi:hypothetical protein